MELHSIKPAKGAVKNKKRIARGQGSGRGGTSTRGHKGAKSRSGRVNYVALNVSRLAEISAKFNVTDIDPETLNKLGIIKKRDVIKILGNGDLATKVNVKAHAYSASALEKIKAQGGTAETL